MTALDINDLRKRAEAGNARAQYMLAATLSSMGAKTEADKWLQSAAALGEPDASYTLATRQLQSSEGAEAAALMLQKAAQNGSTIAMRLLAVLYADGVGVDARWDRAVSLVVEAAKMGDVAAFREIAMLILLQDKDNQLGADLLRDAASRDPVAAAVYVRRSIENRAHSNLAQAQSALNRLASMGYPNAPALKRDFPQGKRQHELSPQNDVIDWRHVADMLGALQGAPIATPEILCAEPDAKVFRGGFTSEECEYVIAVSAARLAPSLTTDPMTGATRKDAYRTSMTATLGPVDLDLALVFFNRRMAAFAERPPDTAEFLSVLHYAPGQEYRPHYDWLPQGADFDCGGQRITTALLYLNDDYEGGETHFLSPDVGFKGAVGDILVFQNALRDGAPDKSSRHASLPVSAGAKWIASKWFREKKYQF